MVTRASTPITIPLMVKKFRSFRRVRLRMISTAPLLVEYAGLHLTGGEARMKVGTAGVSTDNRHDPATTAIAFVALYFSLTSGPPAAWSTQAGSLSRRRNESQR